MILKLCKKDIQVEAMHIPENAKRIYIQYIYEFGTNHLKPRLTLDKQVYIGDRMGINISDIHFGDEVVLKVELIDGEGHVKRTYKATLPYHKYCVIGETPIYPDAERRVAELERVNAELKEEGEVI